MAPKLTTHDLEGLLKLYQDYQKLRYVRKYLDSSISISGKINLDYTMPGCDGVTLPIECLALEQSDLLKMIEGRLAEIERHFESKGVEIPT